MKLWYCNPASIDPTARTTLLWSNFPRICGSRAGISISPQPRCKWGAVTPQCMHLFLTLIPSAPVQLLLSAYSCRTISNICRQGEVHCSSPSRQKHMQMKNMLDQNALKQYLADSPPTVVPLSIKPHFDALSPSEKLYAHHISMLVQHQISISFIFFSFRFT